VIFITETEETGKSNQQNLVADDNIGHYLAKIYDPNLRNLVKKCFQCGQCSGICQLSKVQKFAPSRIIQLILEGFESEVLENGDLWSCLMCNTCMQDCPQNVNFADLVRMAKYKARTLNGVYLDDRIAHNKIYHIVSELESQPFIQPNRDLAWIPEGCSVSDQGHTMFFVGCLPFFEFDFPNITSIAKSTLQLLSQLEVDPIVVRKDEVCCGHDLYWGQADLWDFIKLAKKNYKLFTKAGVSTIVTACAEGYEMLKVEYPKLFDDFAEKFDVKHIIEYVYDKWKEGKLTFKTAPEENSDNIFTYHDPCRLSRFLPKDNPILDKVREIFDHLQSLGYNFKEMEHNREHGLCCGICSWMNCSDTSTGLRYKRVLEAKNVGAQQMWTSCPKCKMHFTCLKNQFPEFSSIEIRDFTEFMLDFIQTENNPSGSVAE